MHRNVTSCDTISMSHINYSTKFKYIRDWKIRNVFQLSITFTQKLEVASKITERVEKILMKDLNFNIRQCFFLTNVAVVAYLGFLLSINSCLAASVQRLAHSITTSVKLLKKKNNKDERYNKAEPSQEYLRNTRLLLKVNHFVWLL